MQLVTSNFLERATAADFISVRANIQLSTVFIILLDIERYVAFLAKLLYYAPG